MLCKPYHKIVLTMLICFSFAIFISSVAKATEISFYLYDGPGRSITSVVDNTGIFLNVTKGDGSSFLTIKT